MGPARATCDCPERRWHRFHHPVTSIPIASAISSAMCFVRTPSALRWHMPEMFIVQPASLQMRVAAFVSAMQLTLSSTMAPLMAGY
jgi:hypothetical protein